jgi:hypothetical protein
LKDLVLSLSETHLVGLFSNILTLARPRIQALLSRILVSDPSVPHLPKPSESFPLAEQAGFSHSFRRNDPVASPPAAPSRPPLLTIDPRQMVDPSSTL